MSDGYTDDEYREQEYAREREWELDRIELQRDRFAEAERVSDQTFRDRAAFEFYDDWLVRKASGEDRWEEFDE